MRVHHVAFRTRDFARLVAFYTELFGFPVLRETPSGLWLDAEGTILMLEHAATEEPHVPVGSMEIVVFGIRPGERTRWTEKLERLGVALEDATTFSLYFRDPDGRRIGVSHWPDPVVP